MNHDDVSLPILRRDAVTGGISDNDLRTGVRRGVIEPVARGLYVPCGALDDIGDRDRHLLDVKAVMSRSSVDVAASYQSAATIHGFAMWEPNLTRTHVSSPRARGGHVNDSRHLHADAITTEDVTSVGGIQVTTPARTISDLARSLDFEHAVCVGDSALRSSPVSVPDIYRSLSSTRSSRGRASATQVLEFLDLRSESVGESRSRVYLHAHNIRPPELQVTLTDCRGRTIARPDFLWETEGLIGEFDGMVKYTKHVRPGEQPGDVLAREKSREDTLRAQGWMVVRWTWADLHTPALAHRIARALEVATTLPAPTTTRR